MLKKKIYFKILCVISVLCWIATIVPAGYVLYEAYDSMDLMVKCYMEWQLL